jgi:polyisoprenoid-binding protein YceI
MSVTVESQTITPGVWNLDPSHSNVGFTVRHAGISKVRGVFKESSAVVKAGEELSDFSIEAVIKAGSFDSGDVNRDGHVKSGDFFDVENFPEWTFVSKSLTQSGEEFILTGDLTIKGVSKEIELDVEFNGIARDPFGLLRAGLEAKTVISRKDFGITWNAALETGGVLVGDKVNINLDLSFVLDES